MKGGPYYFSEPTRLGEPLHIIGSRGGPTLCGRGAGMPQVEVNRDLLGAACQRCVFAYAELSRPVKITRARRPRTPSKWEEMFARQVAEAGLFPPVREHPLTGDRPEMRARGWRLDFAWPAERVAVEVEGQTWHKGGHTSGAGFEDDCVKYAAAVLLGWRVLRATERLVRTRLALRWVLHLLQGRPSNADPLAYWTELLPTARELRPRAARSAITR